MKKNEPIGEFAFHSLKKTLLIMRIAVILLLVGFLQTRANNAYSQKTRLSINFSNTELVTVLDKIENLSEFYFLYNEKLIDANRKVTIDAKDEKIEEVLKTLFSGTDVEYSILDRKIILAPAYLSAVQQVSKKVSGKVTDSSGATLPGVSVVVKGTTTGVITDNNGNYSLSNIPENATLQFSFVGMKLQEIAVGSKTTINVTLVEETIGIEEVVAVGYGTVKKSDLTGAVSSVKTGELQQTPMTSIDQGLVGRASGVQVTQTSGMPGAVASIRVRGSSSIQGGNEPLYVIDGFPVYSGGGFGNTGGKVQMSGLATVNSNDIESVEILKDAAATAIYGARAANGVVLITTKSGKKGSDKVSFEANYGIQNIARKIAVMGAQEYAALVNEAYTNDKLTAPYDAAKLAQIATLGRGTDWQDKIFRMGKTRNYQLTISGGDEKTIYSISGNYMDQEGVVINSQFKRYSIRLNFDRKISNAFKVGTHFSTSQTINDAVATDAGGEGGVVTGAMKMNPILPVYSDVATGVFTQVNTPGTLVPNPVATAKEQIFNNSTTRLLGDIYGEWQIMQGLKVKVTFGTDIFYNKSNQYTSSTIYQSNGKATGTVGVNRSINWLNENTINWAKTLNGIHSFNVLGGFTLQQNNTEYVMGSSSSFVNDIMKYNSLDAGAIYNQPQSSAVQWNLMSYLARVNYSLMDRYLFSLNARADGSSRFGVNNKFGFFPSGSLGWRISEEDFLKPLKGIITNLKLRSSYGFTGNTEIGVYQSLATLGSTSWIIGNQLVSGFYPNIIPNPDLKWEKTGQFDVGLDLGLWNNRIRVTTDYYRKKTTDLLYNVAIPSVSGYRTMLKNIGSVENKGLEFSLETDNFIKKFRWTTAFNISFNKNKVLALGGESYKEMPEGDGHLKTGSFRRLVVGQPIGVFYGYRFDGIFQNEEETKAQTSSTSPIGVGMRRYKDLNGDNKVDANNDRAILGDANPDFFGGLTNTFSYKGIELNVFLQYCYGNEIFNYNAIELATPTGGQNAYANLINRWTPTNPSTIYPKANTNRSVLVSDLWVEDGSYLKLKTLSLSYSFPNLKVRNIQGIKIYVTGQNLLTWTNYSGYDPEVSYRGASTLLAGEDFGGYPQSKTFMLGVKIDMK
ncbi:MAG: TonB-dependent receptor [Bacteroidetes bacterium]|nr:TonB-dependent receptor [Bacteroidota bacterium]MCL6103833.1 TonB-dependent receptor [Bacteroidota bacterium]